MKCGRGLRGALNVYLCATVDFTFQYRLRCEIEEVRGNARA